MTFSFKAKGKSLKGVISSFASLTEELTMSVDAEGIKCKCDDPSHVMLLDVKWPKEEFESFECDKEIQFGIIMNDLNAVIKRLGKEDVISCSYSEEKALLTITGGGKEYELRLIGPDLTRKIPEADSVHADFTCNFPIKLSELNNIIDDITFIDEYIIMHAIDGSVVCSAEGMSSKAKIPLITNISGTGRSKYNIPYLQSVTKAVSDMVERTDCSFGENTPIRLQMYITEKLKISFLLAPKIGE